MEPRIRALFWMELMLTGGMASVFLLRALPLTAAWTHWATGVGATLLYVIAAWRFLSRMAYRERLLLDDNHFTIIHSTFLRKDVQRFLWTEIGVLHYAGRDKKTDHPLKGKHYDYWGFEPQEQMIQQLHQEGNLHFSYGGRNVRFGRNVYSWHAEEIVRMMQLYTGNRIRLGQEWHYLMQEHEWDDAQG